MNETGTLMLTTASPGLLATLHEALPDLRVRVIGSDVPLARNDGRVWCFVDWLLSDVSGLEMCRRLRARPSTAHAHVTMVLDEDDGDARRRALRAGADDYALGPLDAATIVGRIRHHHTGHAGGLAPIRLHHGDMTLDLAAHYVRWGGKAISLRPNDFRLLAHFVANPDQVFTRNELIATLGKDEAGLDERTVDVWVGRLRRALKSHGVPDPLRTVRSLGYVLDAAESSDLRQAS